MNPTTTEATIDDTLAIDSESTQRLFLEARTANRFSSEPVSADTLAAIYELTKMSPTMMNNQPLRITWVQSPEARQRLASLLAEDNQGKTRTAPAVAVLSYDSDWHEHFPTFFPPAPERKAMFDGDSTMRAEIGRNNAWLQAGFFIMAVRAVGLYAGPMGGFDAAGVDADFNAGTTHRAFLVVNIGKPGENAWFPRLPRLSADIAVRTV
ncbi:malonic semialdehyde reductase [Arthrobacter sp. ok362]|uniref:malonic semialdehyde reductase n=1 Tax=Arthrobacter sp. ok362 TaxID=1761745 RepID=UPI000884792A|nr:malonic semialdehyde reductase [Arthrobacter sp. ok362]SDM03230.1 3-hydroxypropanoate dehydrogenase [Arthrobacter sp. ok362]